MHTHYPVDLATEFATRERCHIVELFNHSANPDLSIARCRVEPGVTTELHALAGISEVYVVLEGEGRMEYGETDGRMIGPLDSVVIPPDTPQRIVNTGSEDLIFLAICSGHFTPESYIALEGPPVDETAMRPPKP